MNKEYMLLSDGNVAVSNEDGKIEKRKFENKEFIDKILLYENKIENVNNKLDDLNKKLEEGNSVLFLCKNMIKLQPIIIALLTIVGLIYGGLTSPVNFIINALYNGLIGLSCGAGLSILPLIYFKLSKTSYSKKIRGLEAAIEQATFLKLKYERDLTKLKEISLCESKVEHKINEPISLETQNKLSNDRIENDLTYAYKNAVKQKQKKLVLNNKNNIKKEK